MAQARSKGITQSKAEKNNAVTLRVVRVRETQEYDIEVATGGDDWEAARSARGRFLDMTARQQAASSVGVTGRYFEAGDGVFDEDELTGAGNG